MVFDFIQLVDGMRYFVERLIISCILFRKFAPNLLFSQYVTSEK